MPPPTLPELDVIAADAVVPSRPVASAEDADEIQRLQGIYIGQISARIARMLEEHGGLQLPACQMIVIQSEAGEVLETTADECQFASAEQQEAIKAIVMLASPLPPPPPGLAMGTYLTLQIGSP